MEQRGDLGNPRIAPNSDLRSIPAKQKRPSPDFVPRSIPLSNQKSERGITPWTINSQFLHSCANKNAWACDAATRTHATFSPFAVQLLSKGFEFGFVRMKPRPN